MLQGLGFLATTLPLRERKGNVLCCPLTAGSRALCCSLFQVQGAQKAKNRSWQSRGQASGR